MGVDDLIDAVPSSLLSADGSGVSEDGRLTVGTAFTEVERHWMGGVAAMAADGGRVLVEDNLVSGPAARHRWDSALTGDESRWVGIRCSSGTAARREALRGDRSIGMAATQTDTVHLGIHDDFVVETEAESACALAERIRDRFWPASVRP